MERPKRESATEAAMSQPTDWAALGARILAAARQAVALHMFEVARLKAAGKWPGEAEDATLQRYTAEDQQ